MLKKLLLIIVGVWLLLISLPTASWAQEKAQSAERTIIDIPYESVNPSDGFNYGIKRFTEKLYLALLFYSEDRKIDYYNALVARRLAELKYVIENKDMANFEDATTRYFTTVGQFANFLTEIATADQKNQVVTNLSSHLPVLEDLRDTFGGQETAEWRFVQDDINYVKMYINQLQE